MTRIAVIFSARERPDTTGVHCLKALRKLADAVHLAPEDLPNVRPGEFQLYLNIDDGLRYRLPQELRPAVWWAIDTHLDFDWYAEKGRDFDLIFTAQRAGAEGLNKLRVAPAQWLPLACDPDIHRPHAVDLSYDVTFIGNLVSAERTRMVELLQERWKRTFVGRAYGDDMARIYSASRIAFNRSIRDDLNMRVFEVLSCGTLLLTNDLPQSGQDKFFRDGEHLALYRSDEELVHKVDFFLRHANLRERIARQGREAVLAKHTYGHRMEKLLAIVAEAGIFETSSIRRGRAAAIPPAPAITRSSSRILYVGDGNPLEIFPSTTEQGTIDRVVCNLACTHPIAGVQDWSDGLESFLPTISAGSLQMVYLDHSLARTRHPQAQLLALREKLALDGILVLTEKNARYHRRLASLARGIWPPLADGVPESQPTRYGTRADFIALLESSGFEVTSAEFLQPDVETPATLTLGSIQVHGVPPEELCEFYSAALRVSCRVTAAKTVDAFATTIPRDGEVVLGCVLAVRDRPAVMVERTLQSYAYQQFIPMDKVLVDYGSSPEYSTAYAALCAAYDWRLITADPVPESWSLSDAYNRAVAALGPEVNVVFKNDADVLLGADVLATAAEMGCERLCIFRRVDLQPYAAYPARVTHEQLRSLVQNSGEAESTPSEGIVAFPRAWFESVGGYDTAYRGWGYDDSDLRLRAARTIGTCHVSWLLLAHQWHPMAPFDRQVADNRARYERKKRRAPALKT